MDNVSPPVSVVVVCHNGVDIARRCLASLVSQDYTPVEIIVVDNGSDEDIRGMVTSGFPNAKLIRLKENLGFAGGCNRGIETAGGKYVALINNDAVASPQWLRSMVETAERDSSIGSVASIIIDGNNPGMLDSYGVGIAFDGMSRQARRGEPVPSPETAEEVLLASGCACLYRMEALKTVGLFDEAFFAYCEDTDLGLRLRWAGYRAVAAPDSAVTHYYSMTTGKFSLRKIFWVERNHVWVAVKNFPVPLLIILPFATLWRYIVQAYAVVTGTGDAGGFIGEAGFLRIIFTILRANAAALAGIPLMLRRRAGSLSGRTLTGFEMMKLIGRFRMSMYEIITGRSAHAGH